MEFPNTSFSEMELQTRVYTLSYRCVNFDHVPRTKNDVSKKIQLVFMFSFFFSTQRSEFLNKEIGSLTSTKRNKKNRLIDVLRCRLFINYLRSRENYEAQMYEK